MDMGLLALLTASFLILLIVIQRSEQRRRRVVTFFMALVGLLIAWWAAKTNSMGEALGGFVIALVLSFLFWLLIGRYNPVGSSEETKVLGLDD